MLGMMVIFSSRRIGIGRKQLGFKHGCESVEEYAQKFDDVWGTVTLIMMWAPHVNPVHLRDDFWPKSLHYLYTSHCHLVSHKG
jgi:hypothetical protein